MARWLLYIMILLAIITTSSNCSREETSKLYAESGSPPAVQQEGEQIQWLTFNDGLAKAKTDNLPMFMEFYTDWCVACKAFHRETLRNENVAKMLGRNFVSVRINAEDKKDRIKYGDKYYSSVGLTYSFGITVFPSLVFLDSGGQILTKIHGFVPPTQFSAILNYIHQKCYETKITLQDFVRQGKCN